MNQAKPLDVYVCIDVNENIDEGVLLKCINVFVNSKLLDYKLHVLKSILPNVPNAQDKGDVYNNKKDTDQIMKGLYVFINAYDMLKLKSTNETWFIYVSNGKIKSVNQDVGIILVNKVPHQRQCIYALSKTLFTPYKHLDKKQKMEYVKTFTKSLREVFSSCKTINYQKL